MHKEYIRMVSGAKTAVLMVHGIVGTPRHFDFLMDTIPGDVSVMNILLPGHGGTVQDFAKASMAQWKSAVYQRMEQLCQSHERVILVGHSMGTLLTAEAAQQFPQVKGMLYLNVPLRIWLAPRMMVASLRWCFGKLRAGHFAEAALAAASGMQPDKRLWRYLAWLPRFWELLVLCKQSEPRFETLPQSVCAFQGHDDELVRRASSKALLKNPSIRHIMLPGCGHFAYTDEAREQMKRAMKALLETGCV